MSGVPAGAADRLLTELTDLRRAAGDPSYTILVRQAAAQQPPVKISAQRLSDWFGGRAVPADPAVVRFLAEYLQARTGRYQRRPVAWWLDLHREAVRQRQAGAGERRRAADPPPSPHRLGRPIDRCDPFALEVHRAIQAPSADAPADPLPGYVPRAHDRRLREIAGQVIDDGSSRLVTLVGGSSTGKTRACWELARHLDRRQPGRWRLWHPYDPTRPQAALAGLDRAGPDTIVWLDEAQHYLAPPDAEQGERIAAGLRTLLHERRRVLVLATLWPRFWEQLTLRPGPGTPDPYGQARHLLAGSRISMADGFTPDELAGMRQAGADPRLRQAATHAEGGRITQYLAGAPELEDRYRTAPPAARAIIEVAIDARRLGHPPAIPRALLEQAAPGYLDDHDWDLLGEDWLQAALDHTARPCNGARGPLTRIRARPGDPPGAQPCYRLADYLEQLGRTERVGRYPPGSLWEAFTTTVTDPGLLRYLGSEAEYRGRFQQEIRLYNRAVAYRDTTALRKLTELRERTGDTAGAEELAMRAAGLGDTSALRVLALLREDAGDLYQQAAERDDTDAPSDHAEAEDPAAAFDDTPPDVLAALRAQADAEELLYRQAADHGDADALEALAELRAQAGDIAEATELAMRAATLGRPGALRHLGWLRSQAGDLEQAEILYRRAVDCGSGRAVLDLADVRERAGDAAGADRIRRFGLTESGEISSGLDFNG